MSYNNWLNMAYQKVLQEEGIKVPEKHMHLWIHFPDQVTSLLMSKLDNVIDLVLVLLQFAQVKDTIECLYVSPYSEKHLLVSRTLYYWNLRDILNAISKSYAEALDTYGDLYVECNFPHTEIEIKEKIKSLQYQMMFTTTMTIEYQMLENRVYIDLDDHSYMFRIYLDVFEDYRLDVLPSTV